MPKNDSTVASKPAKRATTRRKKPTLSQQVEDQATLIEDLITQLKEKERELVGLNEKAAVIEQLRQKLQTTEKALKANNEKSRVQDKKSKQLQAELTEKERQVAQAGSQTVLIDDLTTKLQSVEIKLAATALKSKQVSAQNIVKTHVVAGMTLGLLPVPLFDIAALTGTQLNALRSLSLHYDVDFDEQAGKVLLTSLVSGSLPVLAVLGLSSFVKFIPGIGTIGGSIGISSLAGAIIYASGQVFISHFEAGGTLKNFEAKHWQNYFKEQLASGKEYIKDREFDLLGQEDNSKIQSAA